MHGVEVDEQRQAVLERPSAADAGAVSAIDAAIAGDPRRVPGAGDVAVGAVVPPGEVDREPPRPRPVVGPQGQLRMVPADFV